MQAVIFTALMQVFHQGASTLWKSDLMLLNIGRFEKRFIYHIRVLSFWIKRGYDLEWLEKRFLYHIRVLSFWIKRGYDLENTFHKNSWYPSVRPSATHPSVRPSVRPPLIRPSPSVRPPLIRPSVSAFYPNPIIKPERAIRAHACWYSLIDDSMVTSLQWTCFCLCLGRCLGVIFSLSIRVKSQ